MRLVLTFQKLWTNVLCIFISNDKSNIIAQKIQF